MDEEKSTVPAENSTSDQQAQALTDQQKKDDESRKLTADLLVSKKFNLPIREKKNSSFFKITSGFSFSKKK
jgi:hypothetical protein